MIDGGNGLTSWFFCLRKKQAYHVWGPLPLYSLTQLAESKVLIILGNIGDIVPYLGMNIPCCLSGMGSILPLYQRQRGKKNEETATPSSPS
jgi:hypothetical protein